MVTDAALPPPPGLPPPGLPADEPGAAPMPYVEKPIDLFKAIFEADDSSDEEEEEQPAPKSAPATAAPQPEGSKPALPPPWQYSSRSCRVWYIQISLTVCRRGDHV